jgi:hypothetical protein
VEAHSVKATGRRETWRSWTLLWGILRLSPGPSTTKTENLSLLASARRRAGPTGLSPVCKLPLMSKCTDLCLQPLLTPLSSVQISWDRVEAGRETLRCWLERLLPTGWPWRPMACLSLGFCTAAAHATCVSAARSSRCQPISVRWPS